MDLITIEITDRDLHAVLDRLIASGQDMAPVMDHVGMSMESAVSGRFETTTDPDGIPWAPWKPSTVKSYPADGNHQLLNRYGDMLDSLNYQADQDSVLWGFGMPYARWHDSGTNKMDRRGTLTSDINTGGLGEEDKSTVLDIFNGYLLGAIEG